MKTLQDYMKEYLGIHPRGVANIPETFNDLIAPLSDILDSHAKELEKANKRIESLEANVAGHEKQIGELEKEVEEENVDRISEIKRLTSIIEELQEKLEFVMKEGLCHPKGIDQGRTTNLQRLYNTTHND